MILSGWESVFFWIFSIAAMTGNDSMVVMLTATFKLGPAGVAVRDKATNIAVNNARMVFVCGVVIDCFYTVMIAVTVVRYATCS